MTTFGHAVLAVVDGDAATLRSLLDAEPSLATAVGSAVQTPADGRPNGGQEQEGSPLLHYVAANGVEDDLQRSPANAPEICQMLLDAGAPADQLGGTYGGGPNQTCLCLLVSSYHPMASGVQTDLVRVLIAGGAAPNGLLDDGAPLATALTFGYTGAARALAECGARVDNVLFAAGLGDVKAVQSFFDSDDGKLRAGSTGTYVPCIGLQEGAAAPTEPAAIVQEALHFACLHGHIAVADYLVSQCSADVNGLQPEGHHCALPLLQALFTGVQGEMVEWLVSRGADPRRRDPKRHKTALEFVAGAGDPSQEQLLQRAVERLARL
jgi:hypothetical protein